MNLKASRRALAISLPALLFAGFLLWYAARDSTVFTFISELAATPATSIKEHGPYSTKFPLSENPISENNNWTNGRTLALDWANVQTNVGFAYGTESGRNGYDDSTVLLAGTWRPDQTAQATVHSVNQQDNIYEEVELRLRSSLAAHKATGYEINFRCLKSAKAYTQIVRWDGRLGKFKYLATANGPQYGVSDGDTVRATIIGNVITAYINGVQVLQAKDRIYRRGNPGMGFYLEGSGGGNSDYGFSSFTATDK